MWQIVCFVPIMAGLHGFAEAKTPVIFLLDTLCRIIQPFRVSTYFLQSGIPDSAADTVPDGLLHLVYSLQLVLPSILLYSSYKIVHERSAEYFGPFSSVAGNVISWEESQLRVSGGWNRGGPTTGIEEVGKSLWPNSNLNTVSSSY